MASNFKTWNEYTEAQRREIRTACVLVALGEVIRLNLRSLVSKARRILTDEVVKLSRKKDLTHAESECLIYLRAASVVEASVTGIKKLEKLSEIVLTNADFEMVKILKPIAERCWSEAPDFLRDLGFGQLVYQKAVSKFIEFALTWKYTGKGYEAPQGMNEPFSGYDAIINSLMGHPLCKARMDREAKAWQEAYKKSQN